MSFSIRCRFLGLLLGSHFYNCNKVFFFIYIARHFQRLTFIYAHVFLLVISYSGSSSPALFIIITVLLLCSLSGNLIFLCASTIFHKLCASRLILISLVTIIPFLYAMVFLDNITLRSLYIALLLSCIPCRVVCLPGFNLLQMLLWFSFLNVILARSLVSSSPDFGYPCMVLHFRFASFIPGVILGVGLYFREKQFFFLIFYSLLSNF